MTAPAPAKTCPHCQTPMVTRRVASTVPGARPVDLSLCLCDMPTCSACKRIVTVWNSRRCEHCGAII